MARLDKTRRRRLMTQFPPRKCKACNRWAMVGTDVCNKHGGVAPQVRAAAERRITLAEQLMNGPRRPAWEVIDDAVHFADSIMQQAVLDIEKDGRVSAKSLESLTIALTRAAGLAKTALDAGNDARRTALHERQATQMHAVFTRVLAGLGLTAEQRDLVPTLLAREIQAVTKPAIEAEQVKAS